MKVLEQASFAKRLAFLMSSGMTLPEGLGVLKNQNQSRRHHSMFHTILEDVTAGYSFSRSIAKFPRSFSEFSVSIVRIGEASGTLALSLTYLAEELKKKHLLRRKLISAFIYPALITLAALGITGFLILYLFPKITPVFVSLRTELPLSTKVVMAISTFVSEWWVLSLFVLVLLGTGFAVALKKSTRVHQYADRFFLWLPLIGHVVSFYNLANTTRTLSILLKSNVQLGEALRTTADTTQNLVYKEHFVSLADAVNRGERVSHYAARHPKVFPLMVVHLIGVGEASGTLPETLSYLSELYEHEVDEFTKNLSTLIEPTLMIVMGLLVGFIALSIITPIYGITQNLQK